MAEENNKEKSAYIFVDASTTKPDKSYADKPVYSYVYPAWEWLLERTLRRKLILSMFNKDAALAALTLHSGCYRMHRWVSHTGANSPFRDSLFINPYTYGHDGKIKTYRESLPTGGVDITESNGTTTKSLELGKPVTTALNIIELANEVSKLLKNTSFLAPDYFPQEGYSVSASIKENISGVKDDKIDLISWKITAELTPFVLPNHTFFRLLTDIRVDDPAVEVTINDSKGEPHKITLAKTYPAFRKEDLPEYKGVKVLTIGYGGINKDDSLTFYTETDVEGKIQDYSKPSTSPYRDTGLSYLARVIPGPIKRVSKSAIYSSHYPALVYNYVQPNVDWDGEPTWWHAKGFPVGLDSILSTELREQLKDILVTQPAIPPHIPYLYKLPDKDFNCYESKNVPGYNIDGGWPFGILTTAVTPHCIHKMLDALTITVHNVPSVFLEIEAKTIRTTDYESSKNGVVTAKGNQVKTLTLKGVLTSTNILECDSIVKPSKENDIIDEKVESYHKRTESNSENTENGSDTTDDDNDSNSTVTLWKGYDSETLTTTSSISNIIALRSSVELSTTYKTTTYITRDGKVVEDSESGSEPTEEQKNPDSSYLMFPDWLRPWIKKASLFMSFESMLYEGTPRVEKEIKSWPSHSKPAVVTMSGEGNRITKVNKGVLKLGDMNSDGKFNVPINLVDLRNKTDPDGGKNRSIDGTVNLNHDYNLIESIKDNYWQSSEKTETYKPGAEYSRSSSLYVVVEWDFDKEDPEPFGEQPAERTAWKEAESNLTKVKAELEEATKAKTAAETLVKTKEDELDKAREALDNATEENEQMLQEALDKVQEELDKARKALVDAEQAVTDKEQRVEECEKAVTKAKEAFMKLMQEYTGKLR